MRRWLTLWAAVLLTGTVGLFQAASPTFAATLTGVGVTFASDPQLTMDANKPCVQGPDAAWIEWTVSNSSGAAESNLTATLSGFTSGWSLSGGDTATRTIAALANGAGVNEYFYITYPCSVNQTDSLTLTVTDGQNNSASATQQVTTIGMITAQAGGIVNSATLQGANNTVITNTSYSFGGTASGDWFNLQPTGNPSFNAGCYRLAGALITASGVNAIPVNGTAIYYQATASQSGGHPTISVQYTFSQLCSSAFTASPYASQTSGNTNQKYTSNFGQVSSTGTTTAVTSSLNPSLYGQSVTFTATVTRQGATGDPTGTVTFTDGGTTLCANVSVSTSNGITTAICTTSSLALNGHTIGAAYTPTTGDTTDTPSSGSMTQTVNKITTTTGVVSSKPAARPGDNLTFTATVTPATGGAPTGTLTFYLGDPNSGGTQLGTPQTLDSNAQAKVSTNTLGLGTYTIYAVYAGDSTHSGSQGSTPQAVSAAPTTVTGVVSQHNPSNVHQSVTFTATVTTSDSGNAGGTITFYDGDPNNGGTQIGTPQTVAANQASISTSALSAGNHTVYAVYSGDSTYPGSQGSTGQTVNQLSSTTQVSPDVNPSALHQTVTFTATVTGSDSGTPNGTVTFYDGDPSNGGTQIGNAQTLNNGQASVGTGSLALGSHTVYAVYGGDAAYTGSQGNTGETVNTLSTQTGVVSNNNPSYATQSVTFTATVTTSDSGNATGTITFYDGDPNNGGTQIGTTQTVTANQAAVTTSSLTIGSHTVYAVYGGDGTYTGSQGSTGQQVNAIPTQTVVTPTAPSAPQGASVTFNGQVTPQIAGTPTGTLTFYDGNPSNGGTMLSTPQTLSSGTAGISTSALTPGQHTIYAVYNGDGTFLASNGSNTEMVSSVTVTRVGAASAVRHGSRVSFRWTLASRSGVLGFRLTAGGRPLTPHLIPVHAGKVYRFTAQHAGAGPYVLHTVLASGRELTTRIG